ncbi:MAG: sulfatase-like hydrolase/transferase [Pirellulaceae bacterium]|nr:sulfatase-like hydrolase/transferase [Pirellulaceae bacterium]
MMPHSLNRFNRRCYRIVILCFVSIVGNLAIAEPTKPNIVLVVADDLGYADVGCFGGKIAKTPNLDRFAADGLRLTDCYAGNANCSPSRTALMTGRTPMRVGVRSAIPLESPMHVGRNEITIATLLRQAGYATCHVGKWHMNGQFNQPTQPQPNDHGFEHWFSTQNNALPNHRHPNNFVRNGTPVGELEGFAGHLVVDEAIRWLNGVREPAKPFLLYVCFHEPHEPIATHPKYTQHYPSDDPSYSAYYGNIAQMDDAFGRLIQSLDEQRLRDNTLVMFTSDNGPAITSQHPHGSASPLRDKKGSLWEGGIRVPGILRWPGKTKAGSVSDEPICGVDFLPTVCEITGIEPPSDRKLDGASFLPVIDGQPIVRTTPLYWHFPRGVGEPKVAMRIGDWKILASFEPSMNSRSTSIDEQSEREVKTAELNKFFLYNLRRDVSETTELSAIEPAKFSEMKSALESKYREVRAETPVWPHWVGQNLEAQLIVWPDYVTKKKKTAKGNRE